MNNWSNAFQGASGLWFKTKTESDGTKHILASSSRNGVEVGDHDHYWMNTRCETFVQTRNKSTVLTIPKGHLLPPNTFFAGKEALGLFKALF
jgi:hypothetical protein